MTRSWQPPTACQMRCKDCGSDLPRRTYYHGCDGSWRRNPVTTYLDLLGKAVHVAGLLNIGKVR